MDAPHHHLAWRGRESRPEQPPPPPGSFGFRGATERGGDPDAGIGCRGAESAPPHARRLDPRAYQIAMLSALLAYGVFGLHFGLGAGHIVAVLGTALGAQYLCTRLWRLPAYDPWSALISGIGLCTLLRTNGVAPAAFAPRSRSSASSCCAGAASTSTTPRTWRSW